MKSKGLVAKAIVLKDNKFLLLVKPNGQVDLPGGHLEKGEEVCQGLIRELSEETGLLLEVLFLSIVGFFQPAKAHYRE
jgi:8-oxo-dGTP pyrophosphatase MutT (NUDIX family)